jgi:murein DD-endopeptidase MepM/ murein hydrolase activator NlpD
VEVGSDVYSHDPVGKYDLVTGASNPDIVAAADGWVRWIEESFDTSCATVVNGQIVSCCWQFNNYVMIEHPNGEWSQYTHMDQNSVTNAGIVLNQWVTAGTPIGTEGTVGCSTGDHLHIELGRPFDPNFPFDTLGGFLNNTCELLIPVIKGIGLTQSWMKDGDVVTATGANDNCPSSSVVSTTLGSGGELVRRADNEVSTASGQSVVFNSGSSSIFRSGGFIQFNPGFHAETGAKFTGIIRTCNQQN